MPQILEKVKIDIIPDHNYKLPQAVITVNGKESKDPITDVLHFKFGQDLKFDASKSSGGSSKLTSYFWDFGDGQSKEGTKQTHAYQKDPNQVFPLLRVKDENGFFSDGYVQIVDQDVSSARNTPDGSQKQPSSPSKLKYILGGGAAVALIIIYLLIPKKRKK